MLGGRRGATATDLRDRNQAVRHFDCGVAAIFEGFWGIKFVRPTLGLNKVGQVSAHSNLISNGDCDEDVQLDGMFMERFTNMTIGIQEMTSYQRIQRLVATNIPPLCLLFLPRDKNVTSHYLK